MQTLSGYDYIYEPPAETGGPVFLTLHGTGGTAEDLIPLVRNIDQTAGILSPTGNCIVDGQARFFKRPVNDIFDQEDIELNAKKLVRFVNEAAEKHSFDRTSLTWLGYSNGANMIANILVIHPAVITKAIVLRPMISYTKEHLPTLTDSYLLVCAGTKDALVSEEQNNMFIHMLQQTGSIVELFLHDAGHEITEEDIEVAKQWYRKHS